jgi:cell wall-associated NlpC family hydrolase
MRWAQRVSQRVRPRRWIRPAAVGVSVMLASSSVVPGWSITEVRADRIADQEARVAQLADELEDIEASVDRYAEDLAVALDEQQRLSTEIDESSSRIAELEAELGSLEGDLTSVALAAFVSGGAGGSLTALLTSTGGITEAVQREHLTRVALDAGVVSADDLADVQGRLEAERRSLERSRSRMERLEESATEARAEAETRQGEYAQLLAEARNDLGELIVEERARRERERLAEAQRIAEAQRAAQAAAAAQARVGTPSSPGGSGSTRTSGPSADSVNVPPPSTKAGVVVNAALSQLGVPYRFATAVPGVSFDCSGLTKWAWSLAGVNLPHQSRRQFATTTRVPINQARAGDLIYYYSPISHVGIYLGDGRLVHAPSTGDVVKISAVNWGRVVGVTRPG